MTDWWLWLGGVAVILVAVATAQVVRGGAPDPSPDPAVVRDPDEADGQVDEGQRAQT